MSIYVRLLKRLMGPLARNWIVGEKLSDVVAPVRALNKKGTNVLINYIGEDVKSSADAKRNFLEYSKILKSISANRLNADMSVKLTQLCTDLKSKKCRADIENLLDDAKRRNIFVWFDMESSAFTQKIIDIYLNSLKKNKKIGICLQASLKRTSSDLVKITAKNGTVRLVKGAYHEIPEIAYTSHDDILKNYLALLRVLFRQSRKFALGTHDDRIIKEALRMNRTYKRDVEFQMLNGIRKDLVARLAADGQKTAVYMPYGTEWLHYGFRRIRERKRNVLLLLRSL